jgi:Zn-dependent peptidase ImmA (M78 family)
MMLREQLEIIRRHQASAPVHVVPLAREVGLEVFRSDEIPSDYSGMIVRDETGGGASGYAIYVNARHPEVRRRFTIAHEIAHFLLHRDLIGDGIQDDGLYRSGLSNIVEKQANRLAADILMPRQLIVQVINSGIVAPDDIDNLAKLFNVSRDAMSIRVLGVSATQPAAA